MRIFDFIVRRWLCVNGERESGSVRGSSVKGRLFTTALASHISVIRESSSHWVVLFSSNVESTFRTLLVWRSHAPPI